MYFLSLEIIGSIFAHLFDIKNITLQVKDGKTKSKGGALFGETS